MRQMVRELDLEGEGAAVDRRVASFRIWSGEADPASADGIRDQPARSDRGWLVIFVPLTRQSQGAFFPHTPIYSPTGGIDNGGIGMAKTQTGQRTTQPDPTALGRAFKRRLKKEKGILLGGMVTEYLRPSLAKIYARGGFDFVFIEKEHMFFDGAEITAIREKPVQRFMINAGIYLIGPEACKRVPTGRRYDMTDLINRLIADSRRVISFPIREYWMDIGQHADHRQAEEDLREGRV